MAINNTVSRNQYTATASQMVFAYTFEIADDDDIKVEQNGTVLSKTTHYTVSGVDVDTGGNITLVTGATAGDVITIYRDMALQRLSDYQQNGSFTAAEINSDLDRIWMALQQSDTNLGVSIRPDITDAVLNSTNTTLANVATRGGKVLGFDATGLLSYTSAAIPSGDFVDVTTTAAMAALTVPSVGDVVQTAEFSTGNGGGGTYNCVTVGTTPNVDLPNTRNIIVSTADATKCFVLRKPYVSVQQLGYSASSTTWDEVQTAMDIISADGGGEIVIYETANPTINDTLNMADNVKITCYDTINIPSTAGADIINFNATVGASWVGGSIVSDGVSTTQSCFVVSNSANKNFISPDFVTDFRNKGVDIKTGAHHNVVWRGDWSGTTGPTGNCLSVFGAGANRPDHNVFYENYVHDSRGGIAVQGGYYNKVIRPHCEDLTLWGVGLDGVVTDSGDGTRHTFVESPTLIRVINSSFGGVYIGNGSSFNVIESPVCHDCTNGIKGSGGTGYQPFGNRINNPIIDGDTDTLAVGENGIQLSNCPSTEITSCDIRNMTAKGLYLFTSADSKVFGGEIQECDGEGLYLQTKGCIISSVNSHDNDYGYRVEFGGDADSTNRFQDCIGGSNTTSDFTRGISGTYVKNCTGFINENSGTASFANAATSSVVTHGLNYTPTEEEIAVIFRFDWSAMNAFWISGVTSTDFTVSSNAGASGVTGFSWSVKESGL